MNSWHNILSIMIIDKILWVYCDMIIHNFYIDLLECFGMSGLIALSALITVIQSMCHVRLVTSRGCQFKSTCPSRERWSPCTLMLACHPDPPCTELTTFIAILNILWRLLVSEWKWWFTLFFKHSLSSFYYADYFRAKKLS